MVGLSLVGRWRSCALALVSVSLGLAVGCNEPTTSNGTNAGDANDTGGTDDPGESSANPESGGTGGSDTDDGPVDDETGEGGTADPTGPPEETAGAGDCDLDCDNGVCELGEDGAPFCACDEGFASIGLQCVECQSGAAFDTNVMMVDVEVEFFIDGSTPPADATDTAGIYLRSTVSGDEVLLGATHHGRTTRTIIPGFYEVFYAKASGGAGVPSNEGAFLGVQHFDNEQPIEIEIPMATIAGTITINAETPPDDATDFGVLYLVNPQTGDEARLGSTRSGEFFINVIPGVYDVRYRVVDGGSIAPANADKFIMQVEIRPGNEVIQEFTIDVSAVDFEGDIRIAGNVPPNDASDFGRVLFVDAETGDEIQVGVTRDAHYEARLATGNYDVYYELGAGGVGVPINKHAYINEVKIAEGRRQDVNIPAVPLSGVFEVGGSTPPADASDDGVLMLRNDDGDEAVLGNTHDGGYAALVVPGDYELYYAQETAGTVMPGNTNAFLQSLSVGGAGETDLNVPLATIFGDLEVSGDIPPDSVYDDGRVYLRNRETGDSVLLGNTRSASYSQVVVPGTYDVVYEAEMSDVMLPVNKEAVVLEDVVVNGDTEVPINIRVAQVVGDLRFNDGGVPGGAELANIYLEDIKSDDLIWLSSSFSPAYDRPIAAGIYLLRYRGAAGGDVLPANTNAAVACYDFTFSVGGD